MDTRPASTADIDAGLPNDKDNELIYGIQNDELFKLNFMPKAVSAWLKLLWKENGYEPDPAVHEIFTNMLLQ